MGTTLTEHTGHPKLRLSDPYERVFTGGYDWYSPDNEEQLRNALENLRYMQFEPWIPSIVESGSRHFRYLFDISQTSSAFRLPIPIASEFPGIETIQYHSKAAPSDLPARGLLLREHLHLHKRRRVFFKKEDSRRHAYVVGQTGTGKSTLFLNMILQDITASRGVGLIDPHGELIEKVLLSIPENRKEDVVYVNPQDYDFCVGINLLENRTLIEKDFSVNYLMEIFEVLYDLRQTGGPVFEMYMRNSLQLLLDQPKDFLATVLDVLRVFQDRAFRKYLLGRCSNVYARNFWKNEAERVKGDWGLENMAPYITSKLTRFIYNLF